jgi:hypothetical protein
MSPLEMMKERRAAKVQELDELLAVPPPRSATSTTPRTPSSPPSPPRSASRTSGSPSSPSRRPGPPPRPPPSKRPATSASSAAPAVVTDPPVYVKGGGNGQSYFRDLAQGAAVFGDRDAAERLRRHAARRPTTGAARAGQHQHHRRLRWRVRAAGVAGQRVHGPGPSGPVTADLSTKSSPSRRRVVGQSRRSSPVPRSRCSRRRTRRCRRPTSPPVRSAPASPPSAASRSCRSSCSTSPRSTSTRWSPPTWRRTTCDVDFNVINGAGTGANNNSVVNGLVNTTVRRQPVTFTRVADRALFYSKAAGMVSAFATNRFAEPTVWLMHPRRWYWLLAQSTRQGRPLVVPDAMLGAELDGRSTRSPRTPATRSVSGRSACSSVCRSSSTRCCRPPRRRHQPGPRCTCSRPTTCGCSSRPRAEVFRETYADSMGVLFRIYGYVGTILNRQTAIDRR